MTLPHHIPTDLHVPHELVLQTTDVGAFLAMVMVLMGFSYLLFGLHVFRLVTTIQAVLIGFVAGMVLGLFIDSVPIGMLIAAVLTGLATWYYTRWVTALTVGLTAAGFGWLIAAGLGANPVGTFFVAFGSAVIIGAPVLMFYRLVIMLYTSLSGAGMVVTGTAAAIVLIRYHALPTPEHSAGHALVGMVCTLLLAVPSFFFQYTRYSASESAATPAEDSSHAAPLSRKAA